MDIQRFETQVATIIKAHGPLKYHDKVMTYELAAAADGLLPAFISSTNKVLEPLKLPEIEWEQIYEQDAALGIQVVSVNSQNLSFFLAAFSSLLIKQQHGDFLMIDDLIDKFMATQPQSSVVSSLPLLSWDKDITYVHY